MTERCYCPMTSAQLLALGAIAETRSRQERAPAGARALADYCFEHAAQHRTLRLVESEADE